MRLSASAARAPACSGTGGRGTLIAMLEQLRDWLVSWADSPAGPAMLALLSAAESVIFPLPPDPLLIALALRNPDAALPLAALTTVASVSGGMVGHWLGLRLGRPMLRRFNSRQVARVEALFVRHGFWAVFLAGLTPLPYKLFTISAGAFGIARLPFILASVLGRGLRFFMIAVLIFIWGEDVQNFLDDSFDLLLAALGAMLLLAFATWALWMWRGRRLRA